MARHVEPLRGGLVTSKDPAVLSPGELSDLHNATYKPNSQALVRVKGRSAFGTVSSGDSVVGLRDVKFDNGDHYLIAHATGAYWRAAVGDTGTFTNFGTVSQGTQLEVVQYQNRFFLFNGVSRNQVMFLSATATGTTPSLRGHGMIAVTGDTAVTTAASAFSQTATGYYEYWTTEVHRGTQDGAQLFLESTFSGNPATIQVTSLSTGAPKVLMPAVSNKDVAPLMTHWRIYRSPKKDAEKDRIFPSGFLVTELPVDEDFFVDGGTTQSTTLAFPSVSVTIDTNAWTLPDNAFSDNGSDTTATMTSAGVISRSHGWRGFSFAGLAGSIVGIEVKVESSYTTNPAQVAVTIGKQSGNGFVPGSTRTKYLPGPLTTAPVVYTVGGATDDWFPVGYMGPKFTASDFDSTFMVSLNAVLPPGTTTSTINVDYIQIKVYYGSSAVTGDSETPFGAVTINVSDVETAIGRDGQPPISSTADLFEDALVMNDVTKPSYIWWTPSGLPESVPNPLYFIDFETEDNDQVTLIRTVSNRIVVGMKNQLWRVNYLPNENDASFSRGKAIEPISKQFGVVNPMCAAYFIGHEGRTELAFVSDQGIMATDGGFVRALTDALDWRGVIGLTGSTPIALVNDPENWELLFYYRNDNLANNETFMRLHLNYHPSHLREGQPKISGPTHMRNYDSGGGGTYASVQSAWTVTRSNGTTSVYTGYGGTATPGGGKVFLDTGTSLPAQDPGFRFRTRRLYLAGFSNAWRMNELYTYLPSLTTGQTWSWTPRTVKTDDGAGEQTKTAKTTSLTAQKLFKNTFAIGSEGITLEGAVTAGHADIQAEFIIIDGEDFGPERSGK